jgi:glyoxylase-like metal-dependent hydrolase (beta-lactamase superfamily II)
MQVTRWTPFARIGSFSIALIMTTAAGCSEPAGTVEAARRTLAADTTRSIAISGSGRWYQFGQSPAAEMPWPAFDVSSYSATFGYETPAARVQMVRLQVVEPGRARPAPVEQRADQYVNGSVAWNLAPPAGGSAGAAPAAQPQPAAVEERRMEIWTTPHGFLRAAVANNAASEPAAGGGSRVSFTLDGKYRYTGTIDAQNHVTAVETSIDNPVLGDTPVRFVYSDYRDFGGVTFPGRMVREQGGHPVLEIAVSGVTANPAASFAAPAAVVNASVPPVTATAEPLAPGVHYIRGGSHHSVAIEQGDHVVVIEAPQSEARSQAVIAKVKETIPNKPIRYLINTHHHFDHSGGLRTYVDEGATIVTHQSNRAFYQRAWAAARSLNPDRLAQSKKTATLETVAESHALTDGKRSIQIHRLAGNGHNDGFLMVYLPAEKIVVQVDAWAPTAPNVAPPAVPSPFATNLLENIERLKLDVERIAALHGPRVATFAEFAAAMRPAR